MEVPSHKEGKFTGERGQNWSLVEFWNHNWDIIDEYGVFKRIIDDNNYINDL